MSIFWLSFCDADRPKGTQFLGASVVPGVDFIEAIRTAHALGVNPGGEVQGHEVPAEMVSLIRPKWRARLLTRPECEEMDRELIALKATEPDATEPS